MFHHVGLERIIQNNDKPKFDFQELCPSWMCNGPWYNPTVCSQSHGYSFKKYFKTGIKNRYDLMFSIDAYGKHNPPTVTDYGRISGIRPWPMN